MANQIIKCTQQGIGLNQKRFQTDSRESISISGAHASISSVSAEVYARANRESDSVNEPPSLDKMPRKSSADSGLFSPSTDGSNKLATYTS